MELLKAQPLIPDEFYADFWEQVRFVATIQEFRINHLLEGLIHADDEGMLDLLRQLQEITAPPPPRMVP
jgi:hypothetical protein